MPPEIRIPITAKIPKSLHDKILDAVNSQKYADKTDCITKALEKILDNTEQSGQVAADVLQERENEIQKLTAELREKYDEIRELREVIQGLPDPVELAEVRARDDVLHLLLEEKDRRIEGLEREVGNLDRFAHYFAEKKQEVKQISEGGTKKKWWELWRK